MARRKRRIRRRAIYIIAGLTGILALSLVIFFLNFNIRFMRAASVHDDALKYQTRNCLVFYPPSDSAEKRAKEISRDAPEDSVYDYALIPYGDYYLVQYPEGTSYYVDHNYNDLVISDISEEGRMIISDYLRYSMKRDELDEAYSYEFLKATYYRDLKMEDLEFRVEGKDLAVTYRPYDYSFRIPLKYMQGPASVDLGYENELYRKPRYVSKERRMIAFTFDDGPDISLKTSGQIVDQLYLFDSSSTFFILGNRLGEKQIAFCKEAVEKGMEYGSHTQSHANLVKLSSSEAYNEIMIPYHDLYDNQYGFGYRMKLFRPPYGSHNAEVDAVTDLIPVLWNVDSLDWSYRTSYGHDECVDVIFEKVISETDENDVVLFHDIYQTSADAACRLIEYYVKEGYQIVSAGELIEALGLEDITYFSGR